MNKTVFTKLRFVRTAFAVGVGIPLFIASSAFAQDPTPPADVPNAPVAGGGAATAERIIVTGSYIPTAETESALPVTVYTAEALTKQGAQTPVEGLRQLPSFVGNTATENNSNGGDGSAFINLRALGAGNTLTLINGRRAFDMADVNLLGIGSISRTEVLKDGASSIYGSDAVAGVVNFILLDGPNEAPLQGGKSTLSMATPPTPTPMSVSSISRAVSPVSTGSFGSQRLASIIRAPLCGQRSLDCLDRRRFQ